jgi:hypothetical protein
MTRQELAQAIADWCVMHGVTDSEEVEKLLELTKRVYVEMFAQTLENTARILRERVIEKP